MLKDKKKIAIIIIILIIIIVSITAGILFYVSNHEKNAKEKNIENSELRNKFYNDMERKENVEITEGEKKNTSEALTKEREFEGIKIKDISLIALDGMTTFHANIENTTDKPYSKEIELIFVDNDGFEYEKVGALIETIEPGQTKELETMITTDISNAYDFRIQEKVQE